MKKLLAGVQAAALLAATSLFIAYPSFSGDLSLAMPLTMGVLAQTGESTAKVITHVGNITWSAGSTISGSVDIGDAHSQKEVFLVSVSTAASGRSLTAASTTVDGVAVTKATTEVVGTSSSRHCAFVSLPTQSGTVTVTATYSGALTGGVVSVYTVLNRVSIGANQTDSGTASSGATTSNVINTTTIPAGGVWFGCHIHGGTAVTASPAIEDFEDNTGTGRSVTNHRAFGVDGGTTPTDTWSWAGIQSAAAVSWAFGA